MKKEEIKILSNKNLIGQLISHPHTQEFVDEILCRLESRTGVLKLNTTCKNLIEKQDQYIKLLEVKVDELTRLSIIRGWYSTSTT